MGLYTKMPAGWFCNRLPPFGNGINKYIINMFEKYIGCLHSMKKEKCKPVSSGSGSRDVFPGINENNE